MNLIIEQFLARADNFAVLIHDPESGATASIDAPETEPIRARLAAKNWRLTDILTTHHHPDHVEGNLALKEEFGCTITGPAGEADRIPGIDRPVGESDRLSFAGLEVSVIETPGHTLGHICYWIPEASVAFVADTMFAMGCGRVFEGTPDQMWRSLEKLLQLPDETTCYCGHEYTEANTKFALTIEPDNADLVAARRSRRRNPEGGQADASHHHRIGETDQSVPAGRPTHDPRPAWHERRRRGRNLRRDKAAEGQFLMPSTGPSTAEIGRCPMPNRSGTMLKHRPSTVSTLEPPRQS